MTPSNENSDDKKFIGLLAQFEDPKTLVHACDQARQCGYKKMDAFSPFPVHGIDPAIGINRTILPFIVLAIGLGACAVGLGMQYYTNNDVSLFGLFPGYEFKISGKPYFSLPANIPVTFEVIVLSSAFAAFLGMWALNGLPRLANPLHRISRFKRVTNDKFFLMIEDRDEKFDRGQTEEQLKEWGASFIEEVSEGPNRSPNACLGPNRRNFSCVSLSASTGHHLPHVRHDQPITSNAHRSRHGLATQKQNSDRCSQSGHRLSAHLSFHGLSRNEGTDSRDDRERATDY